MRTRLLPVLVAAGIAASPSCPDGPHGREVPRMTVRAAAERTQTSAALMMRFAERTGLASPAGERRYLWTDAFAVGNFLGLARATGVERYSDLAVRLVDRVHHTLGKHRGDDGRSGWISGLGPQAGEAHPTRGGLRIGKTLPERSPEQPLDERLEWERDGQYFHYLTQWMHALDRVSRSTRKPEINAWARELAKAAHDGFVHVLPGGRRRMYWKMSIDLSRPLVNSMGQHDALDGYVACVELQATTLRFAPKEGVAALAAEAADFASMIERGSLPTPDPLGLGMLLVNAYRLAQLEREGAGIDASLLDALLRAARVGLEHYQEADLRLDAENRLPFRELGLAIGLEAIASLRRARHTRERGALLDALARYDRLAAEIVAFWLEPEHQKASTFIEHRDINEVMLATALAPEGFLGQP